MTNLGKSIVTEPVFISGDKIQAVDKSVTGESIDVANKETVIFKPSDQLIIDTRTTATPRQRKPQGSPTDDILFKG